MPLESMIGLGADVGTLVHKFGVNPVVSPGTLPEDIWDGGGLYPFPAAPGATTLVSTNAGDDNAAGLGMRTMRVEGILAAPTYLGFVEDIALAGLVPVNLVAVPLRINRMYGLTAGANATNMGTITATVGGVPTSQILLNRGQTAQAVFTVPGGSAVRRFLSWYGSMVRLGAGSAELTLYTREPGGPWRIRNVQGCLGSGSSYFNYEFALSSGETDVEIGVIGTDVRATCTDTTIANIRVNGGFQCNL